MKILLSLLVAILAIGALAANRPSFEIEPLKKATQTSGNSPYASLAASGDLLFSYMRDSVGVYGLLRRRNSNGEYDPVVMIEKSVSTQVRMAHGKWMWMQDDTIALWKINNANNQLTEESFLETVGGSMLSDDTFVGYVPINDTAGQIVTFEYQAASNTWAVVAGTELDFDSVAYSNFDLQSYRAYDNHLVIADATDSTVKIYQRQADRSWSLNDTISVDTLGTTSLGVHFNGIDTIVFVAMATLSDSSQGVVSIYTKKDGMWNEQTFNTASVGYIGQGNLGASCAFVGADTLLVSAGAADLYNRGPALVGKVLMLTRTNGGDWTPHIDIIGDGADVFGLSIAVNDYDLLVYETSIIGPNSGFLRVYAAPLCFAQPINITCNNEQVDDCSLLTNTQLYTVNQSPRCGAVMPSLNSISLVNQKLQADFTFTRFDIETFSCNATLTCPSPNMPVAPVSSNSPVAPMASVPSVSPIASGAPTSTPVAVSVPVNTSPTAKTSDNSTIQCLSLAVLSLYLAF